MLIEKEDHFKHSNLLIVTLTLLIVIFFINMNVFFICFFLLNLACFLLLIRKNMLKIQTLIYVFFMYILIIWAIFSNWNGVNQTDNFLTTLIVFIPSMILIAFTFEKDSQIEVYYSINKSLMIIGLIMSLYGILLWFFGSKVFIEDNQYQVLTLGPLQIKQLIMGMEPLLRISSITSNPNSLAIWLELSITSTLYIYFINGKRKSFKYFVYIIIQLTALVLTFSRSGYIITFIIIILWLIIFQRSLIKKIFLIVIATLISLISVFYYLNSYDSLDQRFVFDLNQRDVIWNLAIAEITNKPIKGVGFADSTNYLSELYGTKIGVHNGYLTLALEMGILPIIIISFFWLIVIYRLYLFYKKEEILHIKITLTSLLVYLILFIPQQLVEAKIFRFDLIHFLWLYLILFSVVYMNDIRKEKSKGLYG